MPSIPRRAAASDGGNGEQPLPSAVVGIQSAANTAMAEAERHQSDYVQHTTALAEAALDQADTHAGEIWTGVSNKVIDLMGKADKARQVVIDDITGKANAAMDAASQAVRDVGGTPYVLTGEAIAANEAGSHWADAMNRLILPAIQQQTDNATAQADGVQPFRTLPLTPPTDNSEPIGDGFCPNTGRWAVVHPDGTWECMPYGQGCEGGMSNPNLSTTPPPGAPPEGNYWRQCDPVGTPGAPPSPPAAPPPAASPPPASPPTSPPPAGDCPCPVPQLIVRIPGCPDMPIGGGNSGSVPTQPPTTVPSVPQPPPPPPTGGATPLPDRPPSQRPTPAPGSFDEPKLCVSVATDQQLPAEPPRRGFGWLLGSVFGAVASFVPGAPSGTATNVQNWWIAQENYFYQWLKGSAGRNGIQNPLVVGTVLAETAVMQIVNKWVGIDFSYLLEPTMQWMRHSSPVMLPEQAAIDSGYMNGAISIESWYCATRANGNLPEIHREIMEGNRTRPGVTDLVKLHMTGQIDRATYLARMRMEGVLTEPDALAFLQLGTQYWTLTDLMKWMVKDVANEEFVTKGGLDEDFDKSWTPELQRMADQIGVTREQIKFEYRAQWQDIPLGQLYQMYWRLRPGRVPFDQQFTREDLFFMMKIQEVQPAFREKLAAIAFIPINRTDLMASYVAGTIDADGLTNGFLDLGYSPADAVHMTKMMVAKAAGQLQGSMGAWTRRRIVTEYVAGTITRRVALDLLARTVLDPMTRGEALNDADEIRAAKRRKACIAGVKRRFYTGELNDNAARLKLMGLGLEQDVIIELMGGWNCERSSRSKEPTIAMLTSWVTKGIIDWDNFTQRCINLGYTQADADRIQSAAFVDQQRTVTRELTAAERRQQAAAEKAANKAERTAEKARSRRHRIHMDEDHNKKEHKGPDPGPLPIE